LPLVGERGQGDTQLVGCSRPRLRPVDAKLERYRDMISYCVRAAGMCKCNHYNNANRRREHSAYQATRDEALNAPLTIFKDLAEQHVQGNMSKEDLELQRKEQVRSLLALVSSSQSTSARATARKRPAAPAAKGPMAKKLAAAAAGAAAPPARPAAAAAAAGSVTRGPAAAAGDEVAPAAAAATAASIAVPPIAKLVPAAALGRTAAKADDTQLGQEEEEEVLTHMQF
jgi:hypothetical protein